MNWFYFFLAVVFVLGYLIAAWIVKEKQTKKELKAPPWGAPVEKTKRNQIGGGQGEE